MRHIDNVRVREGGWLRPESELSQGRRERLAKASLVEAEGLVLQRPIWCQSVGLHGMYP